MIWKTGFDPHTQTPVEILHVLLLGVVKYLWCDAIQNQIKNDALRLVLEKRLTALNVDGLGITRVAGHTLVQYAGSLTGRDFHIVSQLAPFVLYDLVLPESYAAWLLLSKMVPLIWQPMISNIENHIVSVPFSFHWTKSSIIQEENSGGCNKHFHSADCAVDTTLVMTSVH